MKNFIHYKFEGDALCGTSAMNLTTKQHLVDCPKCLALKPYNVVVPVRRHKSNNMASRGTSLHSSEVVQGVYDYWLYNNENSYSILAKEFNLTTTQIESILKSVLKRKKNEKQR